MARVDRFKEELARWRLCFGLLVAIDASLVGWLLPELSQNVSHPPMIGGLDLRLAALLALPIVTVLAVFVYVAMMRKTDELGELS